MTRLRRYLNGHMNVYRFLLHFTPPGRGGARNIIIIQSNIATPVLWAMPVPRCGGQNSPALPKESLQEFEVN
jgi:hypothetical protein